MRKNIAKRFFAVESSTDRISCAAASEGKEIFRICYTKRQGASGLIVHLHNQLEDHNLTLRDFTAFIVGAGPGSFTGLRISYSLVKGFSFGTNKPAIGVSSFAAIALGLKEEHSRIAVVSDARRGLWYGGAYRVRKGTVARQRKENLYKPEDFIARYRDYLFVTCEEDVKMFLQKSRPRLTVYPECVWPDAARLIDLGVQVYNKKAYGALEKLEPLYIYPKDCQIKR